MVESVIVALITGAFAFAGTLIASISNNSKTIYRIEQLEKKVELHNHVIERVYKLEQNEALNQEKIRVANHRIEDLEKGHNKHE